MLTTHPRALELNINTDINAFSVTNNQLFNAITEEIDLETVTNHELREIFFIVRKQLAHLNWKELVTYSLNHLPFGLNQTLNAWEDHDPCEGCPDCYNENGRCLNEERCLAWDIYSNKCD